MFFIKPKRKEEKPRSFKYKEDDFASSIRTKDRDIPNLKHASKAKTLQSIKDSMGHLQDLEQMNYFTRWLCCKSKHGRLLDKTESRITKELDLNKFITRQRVLINAI